jgi:hypothetical protein
MLKQMFPNSAPLPSGDFEESKEELRDAVKGPDFEALRAAAKRGAEKYGTPDLSGKGGKPTGGTDGK